jgi:hypothetical protein
MKKISIIILIFTVYLLVSTSVPLYSQEKDIFLIHLNTSLKKNDAQICVAYNMIWAAIEEGFEVKVLVDASAINTFKIGWLSKKDYIEDYEIPEGLRKALSVQFKKALTDISKTYGEH